MLPGQRLCFEQEEREECNRGRCILRMLQGNESIVQAEYKLVVRWEHESMRDHTQGVASFHASRMRRFHMQLCSILRLSRPWEKETPTADLVFESEYVPLSVSLADTFDGEPKHISAKDPNEPLKKFWEALVRRGEILRETIRAGRLRAIVEKIAGDNTRLLQYNTSAGFQLWLV